jgi:hypothetical protein
MSTLPALGLLPEFKMAVTKPEAKITPERQKIATRFKPVSHLRPCPTYDTAATV